jgi:thiaminase (transcriptional activator TenA)
MANLFEQLKANCAAEWRAYTEHDFVRQLGDGSLPLDSFKHYLAQDYLFLIHFARAYALAAYKGESVADIRAASVTLGRIVDETSMHLRYCEGWGLSPAQVEAVPEAKANMAYTRFVLEAGMAGDLLDLYAALAPCVVGYAEIGRALAAKRHNEHPYKDWIETYSGADYQQVADDTIARLDTLMARRGGPGRMTGLSEIFRKATRLEVDFWQMGLTRAL